jgi:hypothetical protein
MHSIWVIWTQCHAGRSVPRRVRVTEQGSYRRGWAAVKTRRPAWRAGPALSFLTGDLAFARKVCLSLPHLRLIYSTSSSPSILPGQPQAYGATMQVQLPALLQFFLASASITLICFCTMTNVSPHIQNSLCRIMPQHLENRNSKHSFSGCFFWNRVLQKEWYNHFS